MIGQTSLKYEIFPKLEGLDQHDVEKIIEQQIIKPIENQNENFNFYAIDMKNQVSLQQLMDCIPFIKITFGQLLMILRDAIWKIEQYVNLGFIPEQLSLNNVYLILKDVQFTYFYQKINYKIDIIGVKWINKAKANKYMLDKYESILKIFILQSYTQFKSNYEMKLGQKFKSLLQEFVKNYQQNNALEYINQFISASKCDMEQQLFPEEQNSLRKEFKKINTQIKEGQDIIDFLILAQQQLINPQLENSYTQTILSSLKSHMYQVLYNLLYQEIDAFVIFDKIPEFNHKLDSMLASFNQIIEFDNEDISSIFQKQYQKLFLLKEHFNGYYNLEVNWVVTVKFDFINSYFMLVGQSLKLNVYADVMNVLNHISQFKRNVQIKQKASFFSPIQPKIFEKVLIVLLQQYTMQRIAQLL